MGDDGCKWQASDSHHGNITLWACGVDASFFFGSSFVPLLAEQLERLEVEVNKVIAIWNPIIADVERVHLRAMQDGTLAVRGPGNVFPLQPIPSPNATLDKFRAALDQ